MYHPIQALTLPSGTRLGPYEVVSAIGAGGMGEVYRARDTRLDRTVAIKVLPAQISSSPGFRERFEREARTISSLSHPHICALFDVGHQDGLEYLVMEFLDGETLATRLAKGPLPTEQVLRYGVQIAEALYAAHKHGIIHRDLKPGNVALTKSGAKLLDFGLAKSGGPASAAAYEGATQQKPLTEEGTLLGTFQYMAPEQLEGKDADPRTDIFAFGATLYEMATGKRAFEGGSRASLIASILDRDPTPITQVQPLTPPALERVIRICLAKDPDDRWQSAHDIAAELRWIAEGTSAAYGGRPARAIPRRWLWGGIGMVAGLAIGAALSLLAVHNRPPVAPLARFVLSLPPSAPLFTIGQSVVAISPDGSRIVYRAKEGNLPRLYLRRIDQLAGAPIAGTDEAANPAFSPDGRSIVFVANQKLKKLSLDGGMPVVLADAPGGSLGQKWFGDTIYYISGFAEGIWAIPAGGGQRRHVIPTDPAKGIRALVWPEVLPDGKTIVATAWNNGTWDDAKIVAYPIGGGQPRVLIDGGTFARYIPSGHLLYARSGVLYGVPFDAGKVRLTGTPTPVINGVASGVTNGEVQYAVSDTGTLLYAPGGVLDNKRSLLWIDRRGTEQPVVATRRPYASPVISPDGRTIVTTLETATYDVWQLDLDRDTMSRVSYGGDDSNNLWTADGHRIIWSSSRSGHVNLYWAPADNSSGEERLTSSTDEQFPTSVSPDGHWVAVTQQRRETSSDIMLIPLAGNHIAQPFLTSRFNESSMFFSPDGKWVTYLSNESGRDELYLRPFPGPGGKWQISTDGARGVSWAHNGREIFYRKDNKFFVVPIELQPRVRIGKPQLMFEKDLNGGWDVAADDARLLCVKDDAPHVLDQMYLVLNWFDDLKRRAR